MANKTINALPNLIVADNGDPFSVIIEDSVFHEDPYPLITIEVTVGTLAFASGQPAADSAATYTVGDKLTLTLRNATSGKDKRNLQVNANAGSDAFKISY
ncbi:hypothetical protein LCGC14_1280170 [marine sediment metagenome]|uniref:Uncharacterized protein n=1 Tax=marine sediment metagenome TaxID=412755 RepID=A0A0F9LGS0_9ZZZZ